MRYNSIFNDNSTKSFLYNHSQVQEPIENLIKDFNSKSFFLDLNKHDSFSSTSTSSSDGGRCESPRDADGNKSRHQATLERRHRNFQVKKKTELCKTFQLGMTCPYGSKCSFAHGYDELREKQFVPNNYKTINCKQYFELGFCNYGPRCQFLHRNPNHSECYAVPSVEYKDIFESMLTSFEQSELNGQEIIDMDSFLEDKLNVENFGRKGLQVFKQSRSRYF